MKTHERRPVQRAALLAAASLTGVLAACVAPGSDPSRNGTTLTPSSEPAGSDPTTSGVVTVPGTDGATTTQATTPGHRRHDRAPDDPADDAADPGAFRLVVAVLRDGIGSGGPGEDPHRQRRQRRGR